MKCILKQFAVFLRLLLMDLRGYENTRHGSWIAERFIGSMGKWKAGHHEKNRVLHALSLVVQVALGLHCIRMPTQKLLLPVGMGCTTVHVGQSAYPWSPSTYWRKSPRAASLSLRPGPPTGSAGAWQPLPFNCAACSRIGGTASPQPCLCIICLRIYQQCTKTCACNPLRHRIVCMLQAVTAVARWLPQHDGTSLQKRFSSFQ